MAAFSVSAHDDWLPVRSWHAKRTIDEYATGTSSTFLFAPIKTASSTGDFIVNGFDVGPCLFMHNETDPFTIHRNKVHVERSGHSVVLHRYLSGGWHGVAGDEVIERRPFEIYFSDQEIRLKGMQEKAVMQTVYVSKEAVGLPADQLYRIVRFDLNSPIGKCLDALWNDLFRLLLRGVQHIPEGMIEGFLACIKISLGTPAKREDVRAHARAALNRAIRQFIERNLDDLTLSADLILHQFGISRAGLYRLFEVDGGVRNYIMARRTLRAVIDLSRRAQAKGVVGSVAQNWGFSSTPNFYRAVNRAFGKPPKKLLSPSALPPNASRVTSDFQNHVAKFMSRTA